MSIEPTRSDNPDGSYTLVTYFDSCGDVVEKAEAVEAVITEFDASGRVLLDGALGRDVQNFTTTLSPWRATPATAPSILARRSGGTVSVAMSWNGATEVASWRVLAGSSPGALPPVATVSRSGFETAAGVPTSAPYVAVQAIDAAGSVIGASQAVRP